MSANKLAQSLGIETQGPGPLVFPEVWDVASARILVEAGYPLLSTSASAYAWSQGYRPSERVGFEELLIMAGRIVRETRSALIADLEGCFERTNQELKKAVFAALKIGCRGVFLADGGRDGMHQLLSVMEVANRIKAARMAAMETGKPLFLVARTDTLPLAALITNPFEETVRRTNAYLNAGADMVHVTGLQNKQLVKELVAAVNGPVAISLTHPTDATLDDYDQLGVAGISLGTGLMRAALADMKTKAEDVIENGQFTYLESAIGEHDLVKLFSKENVQRQKFANSA